MLPSLLFLSDVAALHFRLLFCCRLPACGTSAKSPWASSFCECSGKLGHSTELECEQPSHSDSMAKASDENLWQLRAAAGAEQSPAGLPHRSHLICHVGLDRLDDSQQASFMGGEPQHVFHAVEFQAPAGCSIVHEAQEGVSTLAFSKLLDAEKLLSRTSHRLDRAGIEATGQAADKF